MNRAWMWVVSEANIKCQRESICFGFGSVWCGIAALLGGCAMCVCVSLRFSCGRRRNAGAHRGYELIRFTIIWAWASTHFGRPCGFTFVSDVHVYSRQTRTCWMCPKCPPNIARPMFATKFCAFSVQFSMEADKLLSDLSTVSMVYWYRINDSKNISFASKTRRKLSQFQQQTTFCTYYIRSEDYDHNSDLAKSGIIAWIGKTKSKIKTRRSREGTCHANFEFCHTKPCTHVRGGSVDSVRAH